jgi:multiple sugar transport system substrate-binding protein
MAYLRPCTIGGINLIIVFMAVTLAACTTPPSGMTPSAAAPDPAAVTLRFYNPNSDTRVASSTLMLRNFSERYSEATVELEFGATNYTDKIFTMAAAGTLPDIIGTSDIHTAPLVQAGVMLDLQPLAEADPEFDLDDIYENILGLGRVEGDPGLYMIPVSLDTVQMYYHKTLFETANAPLPAEAWTWDDLIAACKVVQEAHAGVHCIGIGTSSGPGRFNWWAYFVPWIQGYGGDILSADGSRSTLSSPESIAGLQAYADLWVKHQVTLPPGSDLGGNCFINQRCAIFFHIPVFSAVFREGIAPGAFEWDVQVIPAHPSGRFTGMGTFGYGISATTKHPQEAWDFIKVVATQQGQQEMARQYRIMPLLKSMADDPLFAELAPPPANYQIFIAGQVYGILPRSYPGACGSLYNGQIQAALTGALESIIRGQATAAEVFPAVDQEIQACLDLNR